MNSKVYKVVLVDDEPIILRSLEAAIPWEELRVQIAGKARNGEEALQLFREQKPDMIISDIRMPSIDGITLMSEVMSINPKLIFIVISGYGDFEYARQAIREGASDYLLKPIDHDELTGMIRKSVAKLDAERRAAEESEELLHSMEALSLLARERMFAELIEGNPRPLQHLSWLENGLLDRPYVMAVVQLDHFAAMNKQWSHAEKRLWFFAIRNILDEFSAHNDAIAMFPFHSGEWVLLFEHMPEGRRRKLGEEIVRLVSQYAKLSCSVGFGVKAQGADQLNAAYQSAYEALYQRFYSGPENVFLDKEAAGEPLSDAASFPYPKSLETELTRAIRSLDLERQRALFDELRTVLDQSAARRETLTSYMVELAIVAHREFEQLNVGVHSSSRELLQRIQESSTLGEAIEACKDACSEWTLQHLGARRYEDGSALIEKARRYIDNHYRSDLGIDEVSEFVGLSTSHFCTLFKQTTGSTFLEYVTECRIDKAKYMLAHSEVKVYQVAPLVGYQDPRYFTQVFKKVTGLTPSEYRNGTQG
ncbi:response regulator [Paenibacillus soyae]|uniref:Response regulator n=1 Tax=Paenibacillus soyae TaxID=2969249 RepID=A0A9X2MQH4_9BACL|nr:response regulator [Paenibacillus soyae]MCR2806413.1 response regulator [Paenibacillus soyae]